MTTFYEVYSNSMFKNGNAFDFIGANCCNDRVVNVDNPSAIFILFTPLDTVPYSVYYIHVYWIAHVIYIVQEHRRLHLHPLHKSYRVLPRLWFVEGWVSILFLMLRLIHIPLFQVLNWQGDKRHLAF